MPICHSNYTPGVHYFPIDWRELGTSNCSDLCRFQGPRGEVTHAHHCLAQVLREAQTQDTECSPASFYNLQRIQMKVRMQTQNEETQTQIESRHNWWRTCACQFIEQPRCDHNNSNQPTAARSASKFYQAKKILHLIFGQKCECEKYNSQNSFF